MATKLRGLRFDQAANLVDDPANPSARVVLTKSATAVASAERDAAAAFAVLARSAARAASPKESIVKKNKPAQTATLFKRFVAFLKDAEAEAGVPPPAPHAGAQPPAAHEPPAPPPDTSHEDLQGFTTKLAEAIAAYGDTSKLPENHPVHSLKALHKEACDKLAAHSAAKSAEAEAARKAAEAEAEADDDADAMPPDGAAPEMGEVTKSLVDLKKAVKDANARADAAEKIAKAERDLRELGDVKTTLRKFKHVPFDVEKEAAIFKKLQDSDKASYDAVIEKLNAAEAQAKLAKSLETDLGSPLHGINPDGAWAQIEAEAEKIVAKGDKGMTKHKAIDLVMKKRPDLVTKHYAETTGSVQ